ncbi:MAG: hypothetical protein LC731_08595, partial [Acidobacteria bacterium]|nr:hypothetical protein [Acidobacteriota bacterium]
MHSENPSRDLVESGDVRDSNVRVAESSTAERPSLVGRIRYWWSLSVAGLLLLTLGPPILFVSWLARHKEWVYP